MKPGVGECVSSLFRTSTLTPPAPTHLALLHRSDVQPGSISELLCWPVLLQSWQPDARASGCSVLPPNGPGSRCSVGATLPKGQKSNVASARSASQMQGTYKVSVPLQMHVSSAGEASCFCFLEVEMFELKLARQKTLVSRGRGVSVYLQRSQALKTKTSLVVQVEYFKFSLHMWKKTCWKVFKAWMRNQEVGINIFSVQFTSLKKQLWVSNLTLSKLQVNFDGSFSSGLWVCFGVFISRFLLEPISRLLTCNNVLKPCRANASLQACLLMSYSLLRIIHKSLL